MDEFWLKGGAEIQHHAEKTLFIASFLTLKHPFLA